MKNNLLFIFFSAGLLVLIFGAVLLGFAANEIYFLRPAPEAEEVFVVISEGSTLQEISAQLAEQKLISSPFLFKLYSKWREADTRFQPGTFKIIRGTSMRKIVNQLTFSLINEKTITIIEGWTIREIATYLESKGISQKDFLIAIKSPELAGEFSFLREKPAGRDLEGFLFPDTYRIFEGATAEEVVRKMLTNFEKKVGDVSYDDLILASIVEREVNEEQDRRMVADIFLRRMEVEMGLQADSTVNYVTGKKTPALSNDDKDLDTPYNTYKYRGLPPGPISNPGLESIRAVREPLANDYWYFLTDQDGQVYYGRILEEHNANKARYLK